MSGYFLTAKVQLTCQHLGKVVITPAGKPILSVGGDPVLTTDATFAVVSGCSANPPCTTLSWTKSATKVNEDNVAILLQSKADPGSDADADGLTGKGVKNGTAKIVTGVQTTARVL